MSSSTPPSQAPQGTSRGEPSPPFTQRSMLILIVGFLAAASAGALTVLAGHTVADGLLAAGAAAGAATALAHRFISDQ